MHYTKIIGPLGGLTWGCPRCRRAREDGCESWCLGVATCNDKVENVHALISVPEAMRKAACKTCGYHKCACKVEAITEALSVTGTICSCGSGKVVWMEANAGAQCAVCERMFRYDEIAREAKNPPVTLGGAEACKQWKSVDWSEIGTQAFERGDGKLAVWRAKEGFPGWYGGIRFGREKLAFSTRVGGADTATAVEAIKEIERWEREQEAKKPKVENGSYPRGMTLTKAGELVARCRALVSVESTSSDYAYGCELPAGHAGNHTARENTSGSSWPNCHEPTLAERAKALGFRRSGYDELRSCTYSRHEHQRPSPRVAVWYSDEWGHGRCDECMQAEVEASKPVAESPAGNRVATVAEVLPAGWMRLSAIEARRDTSDGTRFVVQQAGPCWYGDSVIGSTVTTSSLSASTMHGACLEMDAWCAADAVMMLAERTPPRT